MFLKNFNYYLQKKFFYSTSPALVQGELISYDGVDISAFNKSNGAYNNPTGFGLIELYNATQNIYNITTSFTSSSVLGASILTTNSSNMQTIFGTGNALPTINDYKLSGEIIKGLSSSNVTTTQVFEHVGDVNKLVTTYTISNTTSSDIIIGEIGIMNTIRVYYQKSNSYDVYVPILLERTALDEPITIPAGGIGRVTYTLEMEDAIVSAT